MKCNQGSRARTIVDIEFGLICAGCDREDQIPAGNDWPVICHSCGGHHRHVTAFGHFSMKIRRLLAAMIVVLLFALGSVRAENVKHDRMAALLSDPESDLSTLKVHYNLEAAARLDARIYALTYKRKAHGNNCLEIGLEHAVKHHLKGRAIDVYALAFDAACSALFAK